MTTSITAGDSVWASHDLVGIKVQSHEQDTFSVGTSPQLNTAISVLPLPTTEREPTASTAPILPEQLWDRAYDDLKAEEFKLVMAYEKVLSRELDNDGTSSVAFESQPNQIEQIKPEMRRSQM